MPEPMAMRPRSIELFERLYLLAIMIDIARAALDWPLLIDASTLDRVMRIIPIAVSMLLVLLASRRRHRWAAVVLAALFLIGLPLVVGFLQPTVPIETSAVVLVQVVLQAIAIACLIAPGSRTWLGLAPDQGPTA